LIFGDNTRMKNNLTDTKPEPISAKPNWHYDSYFLAQLERINPQKLRPATKTRKVTIEINKRVVELEIEPESGESE